MVKSCRAEGCQGRPVGRGWCNRHYKRFRKHGSVEDRPGTWNDRATRCEVCNGPVPSDALRRRICSHACHMRLSRLRRYNLSPAQFDEMARSGCAICGTTEGQLHIDHDHSCCEVGSCGKCVRGLLCPPCNRGIGLLGDDADRVAAAANYLRTK